jgi:hypothetical protein
MAASGRVAGRTIRVAAWGVGAALLWLVAFGAGSRAEPAGAVPLTDVLTAPFGIPAKAITSLFGSAAEGIADSVVGSFSKLLEYLFGGLLSTITVGLIDFLVSVDVDFGGSLQSVMAPMYVIGAFLLLIGLLGRVIQAMQSVLAERDTAAHAFSVVAFRICGLALLIGAWHTLIPLAAQITNGMTGLILHDAAVKDALAQSFLVTEGAGAAFAGAGAAACAGTGVGCVVTPAILLLLLLLVACTVVIVLIMKYVLAFGMAFMFVGGPVALGAGGIPVVGELALNALIRSLSVFAMIPVLWCVCFATWAGVVASIGDAPTGVSDALLQVINGPGMFAAAMLVLLGLTRKLLQLATPLGAPIGLPGPVKLALGALAFQVGGPALAAAADSIRRGMSPGGGGSEDHVMDSWATEIPGDVDSTATEIIGDVGARPSQPRLEGQDAPALTTSGTHYMPAGPRVHHMPAATKPEDALLARIEDLRQSGGNLDHRDAWNSLAPDEQAAVRAAADAAVASSDEPRAQQSAFALQMARSTASGRLANPHAAALLGTASPHEVQTFQPSRVDAGVGPDVADTAAQRLEAHLQQHDVRDGDLVGGADLSSLIPPPPAAPDGPTPGDRG